MFYRILDNMEEYAGLLIKGYSQELADKFDGSSLKNSWEKMTIEVFDKENIKPLPEIVVGYIPLCNERVKNIIEEIAGDDEVEFLPCEFLGQQDKYYVMNILGRLDCVDYDKSKFTKYPSSDKIMFFEHVEFKEDVKRNFFRIEDLKYCHYFVNETTKAKLEKAKIKGLVLSDELFK